MKFNLGLLKYMDATVRLRKDITHQEYKAAGINWETDEIFVLGIGWVHPSQLEIVPTDDE